MLIELTSEMAAATDPDYRPDTDKYPTDIDPRLLPFGTPAACYVYEYGRKIGEERRKNPTDDLVSRLVHAEVEGERLDRDGVLELLRALHLRRQRDDQDRDLAGHPRPHAAP